MARTHWSKRLRSEALASLNIKIDVDDIVWPDDVAFESIDAFVKLYGQKVASVVRKNLKSNLDVTGRKIDLPEGWDLFESGRLRKAIGLQSTRTGAMFVGPNQQRTRSDVSRRLRTSYSLFKTLQAWSNKHGHEADILGARNPRRRQVLQAIVQNLINTEIRKNKIKARNAGKTTPKAGRKKGKK